MATSSNGDGEPLAEARRIDEILLPVRSMVGGSDPDLVCENGPVLVSHVDRGVVKAPEKLPGRAHRERIGALRVASRETL